MNQYRTGLARALSKLGVASRTEATRQIQAGFVAVNGKVIRNPEHPTRIPEDKITIDGELVRSHPSVYIALNKPRGIVTTARDEQGRATVMDLFAGTDLPHLHPVGRLDKASEGLLFFTNDTTWSNHLTNPQSHVEKTYHVQIDQVADEGLLAFLRTGVTDQGELLKVEDAKILRVGAKNSWLEVVLEEGRNRHLRRLLLAAENQVLRLVRVRIGTVGLGDLAKGDWRYLTAEEVERLVNK